MKRALCLVNTVILLIQLGYTQVSVRNLRCEDRINPLGLDVLNPRFSWQIVSDQRNLEQTGYEIRVGYKSGKSRSIGQLESNEFPIRLCSIYRQSIRVSNRLLLAGKSLG